jgi:hypothetical protein
MKTPGSHAYLCKRAQDRSKEKCLPMLLQVRQHSFIPTLHSMNPCSSISSHSATTTLHIRPPASRQLPTDSMPIAPAASKRFSPIHFWPTVLASTFITTRDAPAPRRFPKNALHYAACGISGGHARDSAIRQEVNSSRFSFSWDMFPSKPQNGIWAASSVLRMP